MLSDLLIPPPPLSAPASAPGPQERVRIEAAALAAEAAVCPAHVPAVYHFDERMCIIAMQASHQGRGRLARSSSVRALLRAGAAPLPGDA